MPNLPFHDEVEKKMAEAASRNMEEHPYALGWLQAEASRRINHILRNVGSLSTCECGAEIYWVKHANGRKAPYTPSGLNHFADCPMASKFRRRR